MGFNLMYWSPMGGSKFVVVGSNLEKYGKSWKNGRIWPGWGNTAQADMSGISGRRCTQH